ncbi:hypothetical protein VNO77_39052 [Canavalia gladiata]|uniref:BURP domain-containing protein n=1 Tax=Canavalia gladiata TaxID=3824 RepID=A0AAN9PVH2_CANGL
MEFRLLNILALLCLTLMGSDASQSAKDYWQSVWPNTAVPKPLWDLLLPYSKTHLPIKGEENKQYWTIFFEHDLHPHKVMKLGLHEHSDTQPMEVVHSSGTSDQPMGVRFWSDKSDQPMGVRFWSDKSDQPMGVRFWSDKSDQPMGVRFWSDKSDQPMGVRFWSDKSDQPMGVRFWSDKSDQPMGVRFWSDKSDQPMGVRFWSDKSDQPMGVRFWSDKSDQPMGVRFWSDKSDQPMGVRFWSDKSDQPMGVRFWSKKSDQPMKEKFWSKISQPFGFGAWYWEDQKEKYNLDKVCGNPAAIGEDKYCVNSLESMMDLAISKLGKNIKVISSSFVKNQDQYVVEEVNKIGEKAVMCHRLNFENVVFYCHQINATTLYMVPLEASDGTKAKALTICHHDTRGMDPDMLHDILKVKPGTVPVCHFVGNKAVAWVPNPVTSESNHPCVI